MDLSIWLNLCGDMDLGRDDDPPEQSDLQRMMADLRKKGWSSGRLNKIEDRWDRTLAWGGWAAGEQVRRNNQNGVDDHAADPQPGANPVEVESWEARYRIDPPNPAPEAIINCAERVHLCKAVCCKLNFALTPGEVRSGKVQWDHKLPYLIAHKENGYCAHLDEGKGCNIFEDRPALCRRFDCRTDGRVWKDFDAMVPNREWIDGIVASSQRVVVKPKVPLPVIQVGGNREETNSQPSMDPSVLRSQ
jgi:Fe-S-cluster containining protein